MKYSSFINTLDVNIANSPIYWYSRSSILMYMYTYIYLYVCKYKTFIFYNRKLSLNIFSHFKAAVKAVKENIVNNNVLSSEDLT